jgi:hypothetical protein
MDGRFNNCPNVLIAKDYHTSIEQDLALINAAAIHMGASSGPGMMALFSAKPYLLLNAPLKPLVDAGFIQNGNFARAFFANSVQQITVSAETADMLRDAFDNMWASLDMEFWNRTIKQPIDKAADFYTWLR